MHNTIPLSASEAFEVMALMTLSFKGDPEREVVATEVVKLASDVYDANFAGKRGLGEFALFISTLIYRFAENVKESNEELKLVDQAASQVSN